MPRLAIVITANGSIESLESTLVSVLENRPAACEIVVALNAPYNDPYALSGEVRFVPAEAGRSGVQATAGALATVKAPFVHLLASGCKVTEGWADRALQRFGDKQVAAVVPWVTMAEDESTIFAVGIGYWPCGVRYRVGHRASRLEREQESKVIGPGSFAGFYRKSAIDSVGGLCTRMSATTADAELAIALLSAGLTCVIEPQARVTAGVEVDRDPAGFRKALGNELLFWRSRSLQASGHSMARHALAVGWEFIAGLPRLRAITQLAGRTVGCLTARRRGTVTPLDAGGRGSSGMRGKGQWRVDRPHSGAPRSEAPQAAQAR